MKWIEHVNMSKNQYVDSVMRVLGKCSNEVILDDLEELQILLESEYDKVLERRELFKNRISDLAQRISESAKGYTPTLPPRR